MNSPTVRRVAPLLCLLLACGQPLEPSTTADSAGTNSRVGLSALADAGGTWSQEIQMDMGRSHHAATLLLNGKVLITGGVMPTLGSTAVYSLRDAELYDLATGRSSHAGEHQYRFGHTATLLRDGRVLVAGGFADNGSLSSAEIYDPNCAAPPKVRFPAFTGGATCSPWTLISPMKYPRAAHTATLLRDGRVLVVGGVSLSASQLFNSSAVAPPEVYDPATGQWKTVADPKDGNRAFHTATLLSDGKVLVLGGAQFLMPGTTPSGFTPFKVLRNGQQFIELNAKTLDSAELYNPDTEQDPWTLLDGGLTSRRIAHTATLMPEGKVLVVGGWDQGKASTPVELEVFGMAAKEVTALDSAELYDPSTGRSVPAGSGLSGRAFHTATLLPDGRVLVTGGGAGTAPPLDTTWVYDPNQSEANRWSPAARLPHSGRALHTATLLPNGRVLVTGGYTDGHLVHSSSILYDADTGAWSSVESMREPRSQFTATLLPDETVLVAGGTGQPANGGAPLGSAEFYAASEGGSWSEAPTLCEARRRHTATLLPDGTVLLAGGFSADEEPLDSAELYDPASSPPRCIRIESPLEPRGGHTATLLPTGRVLLAGGIGIRHGKRSALQVSEEYDIATKTMVPGSARDIHAHAVEHTATLLPDGKVLLTGGRNDANVDLIASLYDPIVQDWILAETTDKKPSRRRYSHTATLLPDGRVFVAGGYNELGQLKKPSSDSELYAPTSQTWTLSSARMSKARAQHAALLLPTGQVLVTGGYGEDGAPLDSAELYDPGTDSWSPAPRLLEARADHAMVALPDGNLLVLGGTGASGVLSSSELYALPVGNPALAPLITWLEPPNDPSGNSFEPGMPLTVGGERFRGGSEGSGGGTGSSAVDFPLLRLRSFETGQWITPPGLRFSDTSITVSLPPRLPYGHYQLNVTSSGQTTRTVILLRNLAPPDTFFTSPSELPSEERAESVSFQFSSNAGDVHSFECSVDGADFTPCTSPLSVANLDFGNRTLQVRARDLASNVDPTPAQHTWRRAQISHYGFNCSVGDGSLWQAGPWALLLLGLRRRRRPR